MKRLHIALILIAVLALSSCATVFFGTQQRVRIETEPAGAKVLVNGMNTNKVTPCEISIPRRQPRNKSFKRQVTYQIQKDGYNHVELNDVASKNGLVGFFSWYPLILPGVIDMISGSNNLYAKNHKLVLTPSQNQVVYKTDTIVQKEFVYVDAAAGKSGYVFAKHSDVDKGIAHSSPLKPRRFALIIGNEDYSSHQIGLSSEIDVHFARNDASAFKEYAQKVFGIPERNITFLLDATTGQMKQAISKMNAIIKSTYGEAEVFVYYAGHGLPDESTREPYLMPVDVSGKNAADGIKLTEMYQKLTEYPSKRVTVFVDACFSGGARDQGLIAARGVRVRPKQDALSGNLVVFTASSGDQSSLPYNDQQHGFFTYYLLKLLKERGPNVSYGEIADYMKRNVEVESILVNEKEQSPQVIISPSVSNSWMNWSFE